jgi:Family of unknown function (DUF6370)
MNVLIKKFGAVARRWDMVVLSLTTLVLVGCGRTEPVAVKPPIPSIQTVALTEEIVEAACGECQFGMEGKSCDLAIRHSSGDFFVDGSSIDDHGNAHSEDGLCNCKRKAKVTGTIENGRFVAKSIKLMPLEKTPSDK